MLDSFGNLIDGWTIKDSTKQSDDDKEESDGWGAESDDTWSNLICTAGHKKRELNSSPLSGCGFYFVPSSNKAPKPIRYIAAPTPKANSAKALGAKNKHKSPTTNRTIPKQAKITFFILF